MKLKVRPFDIYIFLITLFKGLGADATDKLYVLAFAVGCLAVFMKMLQERYTRHELLSMMFIGAVGLADYLFGKNTTILFTAVAVCGMKNINVKRVIKIVFLTRVFTFLAMICGSQLGVVDDKILLFYRDGGVLNRHTFGYGHPNNTHMAFTIIILLLLHLYGKRMRLRYYLCLVGLNYLLFYFTYSRTGLHLGNISLMLHYVLRYPKPRTLFYRYGKYAYVLMFIFTIAVGLLYGKIPYLDRLNETLSGRVAYIHLILTNFMPPIVGSTTYNTFVNIDNGFIVMIYQGGLLAFGWISYYMIRLIKKLVAEQRLEDFFLVTCFIIYSFTESFFPSISVNVGLLFFGEVVFKNGGYQNGYADGIHSDLQQAGES